MGARASRVSYVELERWPDDGRRYELFDGEVWVVPAALPRHQAVATQLASIVNDIAQRAGALVLISPIDIVFSEYDVLQPDVVFFRPERRHLVRPDAVTREIPDVVMEVLSPSTAASDRGRKAMMFHRYGVPEYWVVDPKLETIEVLALGPDSYRVTLVAERDEVVRSTVFEPLQFRAGLIFPSW